jgi:hypothetical protein
VFFTLSRKQCFDTETLPLGAGLAAVASQRIKAGVTIMGCFDNKQ